MAEKTDQCGHPNCNCPAPAVGDYCSEECQTDEKDPETPCRCGHRECEIAAVAVG